MQGMIVVAKEVDGVEMGVLKDGTPFLTGRGLAKACGVVPSAIIKQAEAWSSGRRNALGKLLADAGFDEPSLFVQIEVNKARVHAYTDSVCTIILEYYAFDADPPSVKARDAHRRLNRFGLRQYIYSAVGYDPKAALPLGWREFQDRLLLSTFPPGYFSVFREMSEFLLRAIQVGLRINDKTVPDISVGKAWSQFWVEWGLETNYGHRKRHEHNYPEDYPQAQSNPQEIWVYPVEALGAFRRWLDDVYIPDKFPAYLDGQIKKRTLDRAAADKLIVAVTPAALASDENEDETED